MRCFLLAVTAFAMLPSGARADDSDDTLRYYLSKTELCVGGTIVTEPIGIVDEAGIVNYACDFAVSEVLKGELKDRKIRVNVIRHEIAEADRLPSLKEGAKCILFLKAQPRSIPPWATVDFWFGYQSYSSAMARGLKRVAETAEEKPRIGSAKAPAAGTAPEKADRAAGLAGSWLMTLPLGAKHKVLLRARGKKRFSLDTATRFAGEYELKDDRLVWVKPADPAEEGFDWEVRGDDEIVLVTQRPGLEFDYVGTTLQRLKGKEAEKPAPAKDDAAPKEKRPGAGAAKTAAARWDASGIDGGFMFRDAAEFQAYVAGAGTIALGQLAEWDGSRGTLKVEKVHRGQERESLSLAYTGGTVAAKAGDKVFVLLAGEADGKLHSYCAASGLFRDSDALTSHVEKALQRRAEADNGPSEEEAKAAKALRQIKLEHRLRKEPAYVASVQYCLLILGRDAKTRLWLASDGTTMYVDRNGDGDLTDPAEAIPYKNGFASLMPASFSGHDGDGDYTSLHIAVRQRDWKTNTGGYWAVRADMGSTFHMYAMVHKFAQRPQDAPVVHLGGPLRMGLNDLLGGRLVRGREVELEAYAACHYPGVERAFVDVDRRCPKDVHPLAEIRLPAAEGAKPLTLLVPLTKRC